MVATENECFTDCGFTSQDVEYVVRQSNLKALQLRMNWVYVVPGPSYLAEYPEHWDWVRLSLGQTASTSADAWAALRDAEDTYWGKTRGRATGRSRARPPGVTDRGCATSSAGSSRSTYPGAVAHRSDVDVRTGDPVPENGTAYEGLRTSVRDGDTALAFRLDPGFLGSDQHDVVVKVTYWDSGSGGFTVEASGATSSVVPRGGDGRLGDRHRVPRGRHCGPVAGRGRRPAPGAGRRGG